MSISFRAEAAVSGYQTTQSNLKKNVFSLSENGQKVLSKTNEWANTQDVAEIIVDKDKRTKENIRTVAQNTVMMPVMSDSAIGTAYILDQCKKGNLSKDDAIKILAYNMMTNGLPD